MVVPMNHSYIELDDYRFICFSLLFAAAVCFSLNSYKMTLDVTVRQGRGVVPRVVPRGYYGQLRALWYYAGCTVGRGSPRS